MCEKTKQYYRERIKKGGHDDFLWQVGKTVNGKPVLSEQIDWIVENIVSKLRLNKNDVVLDIGCANGLLTKQIAKHVSKITGIELTSELYDVAKNYNSSNNITYVNGNVLDYDIKNNNVKFTKVYLYEVIQHFGYQETDMLFSKLKNITVNDATIFIGGVLDIEKKWNFFDTEERRCVYFNDLISGSEPLGTWYHKDFFNCLGMKYDIHVESIEQKNELYTSHYRFDSLLHKK